MTFVFDAFEDHTNIGTGNTFYLCQNTKVVRDRKVKRCEGMFGKFI